MASKKYTDGGLASASPLDGTERWGVARGGADKYVTTSMLPAYLGIRAKLDNNVAPFNNITIPNNTLTALTIDNLVYDTGGFYSASHPTRLTAPVAGLYLIRGEVSWSNSTVTGIRTLSIYVNGSAFIPATADDGLTTRPDRVEQTVITDYLLAANDYVELKVYQTSGGNLDILQQDWSPVFSIVRIG